MKFNDWYVGISDEVIAPLVALYGKAVFDDAVSIMAKHNNATFLGEDDDEKKRREFFLSQIDRVAKEVLYGQIAMLYKKKNTLDSKIGDLGNASPAEENTHEELAKLSEHLAVEIKSITERCEPIYYGTKYEQKIADLQEGKEEPSNDLGKEISALMDRIDSLIARVDKVLAELGQTEERHDIAPPPPQAPKQQPATNQPKMESGRGLDELDERIPDYVLDELAEAYYDDPPNEPVDLDEARSLFSAPPPPLPKQQPATNRPRM